MNKESSLNDRNFDGLATRFKKNVYGGLKGAVRLAVLERDFAVHLPGLLQTEAAPKPWRILDAGGGQGQFSLALARAGHQLVICDISADMLAEARATAEQMALTTNVTFIHCAFQDLATHITDCQFDLVLSHAVMEWLAQPQKLLPCLYNFIKPGGHLSLTFYNRHSLVIKNLLRGNFRKVLQEDFAGAQGSLTPIHPMDPQQVDAWLAKLPLDCLCRSGIRVFHDYILETAVRERDPDNLLALELRLSQQEPYRSLGRYLHYLVKRPVSLGLSSTGSPGPG